MQCVVVFCRRKDSLRTHCDVLESVKEGLAVMTRYDVEGLAVMCRSVGDSLLTVRCRSVK
ncbi:hypothetical protein Hamer_G032173 [Homarus americanus]|uniref:Uncharacterized protein n=1 Tax=Homarus americanus TaxID=6706 RepID=A0A8J5NBU0_HOMAM|nr:hypothetical protein Hamer_G032173 [Homarus americanus]